MKQNTFRRDITKKDQKHTSSNAKSAKSLLDFHPVKVAKSKIEELLSLSKNINSNNKATLYKIDPRQMKYQSFLKSFEAHLEGMNTLSSNARKRNSNTRTGKSAGQKHQEITYHIKASDNVTSFPYNLPFATQHSPSPVIPSPKHGPVHPFRDLSVAHLSPWLHSAPSSGVMTGDFPVGHTSPHDDVRMSDQQVQDILLQPEPIIGPARSNTNLKPSVVTGNTKGSHQNTVQPRHQIQSASLRGYDIGDVIREVGGFPADVTADINAGPISSRLSSFGDERLHQLFGGEEASSPYSVEEQLLESDAISPPETNLMDAPIAPDNLVKPEVRFSDLPPSVVNAVSDLPINGVDVTGTHVMGPVGQKNPVVMVAPNGGLLVFILYRNPLLFPYSKDSYFDVAFEIFIIFIGQDLRYTFQHSSFNGQRFK